jgi:hypothetical protein
MPPTNIINKERDISIIDFLISYQLLNEKCKPEKI